MREIKFRCYQERDGFYFSFEGAMERFGFSDFKMSGLIWEQYVGIKDENGVDVYEGDRVKLYYKTDNGTREVTKDIEDIFHAYRWLNNNPDSFEVIGNIHESSEKGST